MPTDKIKLDLYDRAILKVLTEYDNYLSVKKIAKKVQISWNTALRHLQKLEKLGLIEEEK